MVAQLLRAAGAEGYTRLAQSGGCSTRQGFLTADLADELNRQMLATRIVS